MSIFLEDYANDSRKNNPRKIKRDILKIRYNNGVSRSSKSKALCITIPAFVAEELQLHHGDIIKMDIDRSIYPDRNVAFFRKLE